jgi:hypothetical protein
VTQPRLEIHHAPNCEWSALYVDGQLEQVGDTYLVEEQAWDMLGVTIVDDNAFLRGQASRDGVARTLDEVAEYRAKRDEALDEATRLRAEAKQLMARADELDRAAGGAS